MSWIPTLFGGDDGGPNSQRSQGSRGMCDYCGQYPKNQGFNYCSRTCGANAAKQASAYVPAAGPPGAGRGRYNGMGQGSGPQRQSTLDDNLCETCHSRPKMKEKDQRSGRITIHPFCSRSCADRTSRCKLRDCTKQAPAGEDFCSDRHGKEAVRNREVPACPICLEYPINPGFNFCSKKCALKAEDSERGPLRKLDQQDPSANEAARRFMTSWQASPSEQMYHPTLHAIYDINLPRKYEKRFTEALERGGNFGGFTVTTAYYGGQLLCDLGADGVPSPKLCNWPGCSICIVVTKAFDVLEFGAADNDGLYGRGIYTHRNPADANLKTVGKSTNPFRAIIACSVVVPTSNSRPDKKNPVVMDQSGLVMSGTKDTVIPRHLIIYKLV